MAGGTCGASSAGSAGSAGSTQVRQLKRDRQHQLRPDQHVTIARDIPKTP